MNQHDDIEDLTNRTYHFMQQLYDKVAANPIMNKIITDRPDEMRKECFSLVSQYFLDHENYPTLSIDLMSKVLEDTIHKDTASKTSGQFFERYMRAMREVVDSSHFHQVRDLFNYEDKKFNLEEVSQAFLASCAAYFNGESTPGFALGGNKLSSDTDRVNRQRMHELVKEFTGNFSDNLTLLEPLRIVQTLLNKATALAAAMNQSMTGTYQSQYAHLMDKSAQMVTQLQIDSNTPSDHLEIEPLVLSERIHREREAKEAKAEKPGSSWGYVYD